MDYIHRGCILEPDLKQCAKYSTEPKDSSGVSSFLLTRTLASIIPRVSTSWSSSHQQNGAIVL